ncbi:MAG: aminopeptidase N [Rhodothermales bacterium]|jgi:aminopeptidase N
MPSSRTVLVSIPVVALSLLSVFSAAAQPYTRADTLRGSDGAARAWWDVTYYDLAVYVSPEDSSLAGTNEIHFRAVAPGRRLQIDLQPPMHLEWLRFDGADLPVTWDGSAWFAQLPADAIPGTAYSVLAAFTGRPRVAINPPWDGGYQWETDESGNPWVATSNQGLGASIWWPNKDFQADEPDSQRVSISVPQPMVAVSNGRLAGRIEADDTVTYSWVVQNPINNYSVSVNAGSYGHWSEEYDGEDGPLSMDFWPLAENYGRAREQWTQARSTVACFEHWFGPYPFYEDGYKLIEVPYLGMEHQSGVTYGNGYANGYLGRDLSGTGWGLQWDFIIVHESAHEWWGNNITASDIADNWVHESFANYSESLYTECLTGSAQAAEEYVIGTRKDIANQTPIIAPHGVNATPPGDMYNKGGNMLHTIRRLIDDDEKWRGILRGLNRDFRHQIIPGTAVEDYITRHSGLELGRVFDQYLRDTRIPVLEWSLQGGVLGFRWADVVHGFAMPVRVSTGDGEWFWIRPTASWQTASSQTAQSAGSDSLAVDLGLYVLSRRIGQ